MPSLQNLDGGITGYEAIRGSSQWLEFLNCAVTSSVRGNQTPGVGITWLWDCWPEITPFGESCSLRGSTRCTAALFPMSPHKPLAGAASRLRWKDPSGGIRSSQKTESCPSSALLLQKLHRQQTSQRRSKGQNECKVVRWFLPGTDSIVEEFEVLEVLEQFNEVHNLPVGPFRFSQSERSSDRRQEVPKVP